LDATAVTFDGIPAESFWITDATYITATAPPHPAGVIDVRVTNSYGTSSTSIFDLYTYIAASAPAVTSLSPSSGYTTGGTEVTISGTNFTGASEVKFGTQDAEFFDVDSDTQITAYAPASDTTGIVDVTVTTPSGTSTTSSADQFTYSDQSAPTVTSLSPT